MPLPFILKCFVDVFVNIAQLLLLKEFTLSLHLLSSPHPTGYVLNTLSCERFPLQ